MNNLSLDTQIDILSQDTNLLITGIQLNKQLNQRLTPLLLKRLCKRPLTFNEVKRYIDQKHKVGILSMDQVFGDVTNVKIIIPMKFNPSLWIQNTITVIKFSDMLHYKIPQGRVTNDPYIYYEGDYDILTTYNILKTRIGCNNILPDFAKIETLLRFNEFVDKFIDGNIYDLMTLYLYLIMHIDILNLNITPVSDFTFNITDQTINSNWLTIKTQISILIDLIRQYLINF